MRRMHAFLIRQFLSTLTSAKGEPTLHRVDTLIRLLLEKKPFGRKETRTFIAHVKTALRNDIKSRWATVTTTQPLSPEQRRTIRIALTKKQGKPLSGLQETIDPSIISGMKVQLGDMIWDVSIAGRFGAFERSVARG